MKGLLAPYECPKSIGFVGALPKTATGNVKRFELPSWRRNLPLLREREEAGSRQLAVADSLSFLLLQLL